MIYEACLLKSGGKAVIISLEAKIGKRKNRQDMQDFFESIMGQTLEFKRFRTYSDNAKKPINSLRITIMGSCLSKDSLDTLLQKARQIVGVPKKDKILYKPADNSVELWKIIYRKKPL